MWIYLIAEKSEVASVLKEYFLWLRSNFYKNVKIVRNDNGTEFMCLKPLFLKNVIVHKITIAGTPQQNGKVERHHRHILNVVRALRFQSNSPKKFLRECVLTTCYLINGTPSKNTL